MAISSVGSSGYLPVPVSTPAAATAAKPDTDAPAPAATTAAKPDTDAPKPETAAAGPEKGASSSSQASTVNLTKINPDGTVGPFHTRRHPNSPGVIHA